MLEPLGLTEQDAVIFGSGFAAFIATILVAWRGAARGKPTPAAQAVASISACEVGEMRPILSALVHRLDEHDRDMTREMREVRDIVVRLEDRTRRD
ncbi:hypothetical protein [Pseudooceanicola algae]|uniref:Uncharacterized protein n=1 Tax=Pseudooceanicola algae TaxID=1537215 RepID=A0A418SGK9_9RHOB|nr:hypothetical protein [Pseudooceanicola algae]QPM89393.1 hypothetical protein PSAL_006090 [Pseudooceanicola algae]QPM90113.1 hypothetical protein PSAL_013470 [Pseudooceanicola algae]